MRAALPAIVCVALTTGVCAAAGSTLSPSAISLVVQPTVVGSATQQMTIYGSASNARADEKVTIQFKACGLNPVQFRDAYETTTDADGGYSVPRYETRAPWVSGVFRAVHRDSVSAEIPVWQQAPVFLRILKRARFEALVTARTSFWRRYVVLQKRARGAWTNVRRLVLTEQRDGGSTATFHTAPFRPAVPRGTRIRVVFPLSQAKPCYIAGVSQERRT